MQNLDIVTWNIENFPKHPYTIDYIVEIIEDINVDIIALQEISESNDFLTIIENIEDWSGYYASWPGLAYLYNTNTVAVNDVYEIYATSNYWYYFPRSPYVMEITYNNIEDKYELTKYEESILKIISQNLAGEIMMNIASK